MATFIVNALDAVLFSDGSDNKDTIRENLIFSDTATLNIRQTVYLQDGIKITTKGKTVYSVNVYDTMDFVAGTQNMIPAYASDTFRVLDASYKAATYTVELNDNVDFDDTETIRIDFTGLVEDEVVLVDSPYPVIGVLTSDNVLVEDSSNWFLKHPVNDTATFTDQANVNVKYAVNVEDTVEFSEAHKFSIWGNAADVVQFLDNTDEVRVRGDAYDEAQFSDHVQVFNRYKESCADELILSDLIDGEITPYIKWLSDDLIVTDETESTATYRVRQREVIGFSDDTSARKIVRVNQSDNVQFSDGADASVAWSDPLTTDSIATFTDTCSIRISRYVTTEFTNALVAGVGISEVTMYTSPTDGTSTILNISLCNVIASDITTQVVLYKGGVTPFIIRKDLEIGVGETYVINNIQEESINIEDGDEIRVSSSDANSLDVFLSVIEQTQG